MVRGLLMLATAWLALGARGAERVGMIHIKGTIGPATASYVARALKQAGDTKAQCLIIQLDTPGGMLDSTKDIVQTLYAAPIPTVVYVAPSGAGAGSAGCFITLAADVAAMAPNTTIGAAHPVTIGGGGDGQPAPDAVMKEKLENYAASFIEAIATKRKRNVEWARSAVRDSASITAETALEKRVIDLIAKDLPDLLRQLNGRELQGRALRTQGAEVTVIPMRMGERVFQYLAHPQVLLILILLVTYGIIGELSNPGTILPGVVGVISLILALYLAAILPVNVAGVALILLAIGLFIGDVFATAHGVLTVGGIISFFLGALMLFDRSDPALRISLPLIISSTLVTAAFFFFVVAAGLRAQFMPVKAGKETMIGKTAKALAAIGPEHGKVLFEGEYWNAVSPESIAAGEEVEIVGLEGLTLRVKPK